MYVTNSFLCHSSFGSVDDCISDYVNAPIADVLETNLDIAGSAIAAVICTATKIAAFVATIFLALTVLPIVLIASKLSTNNNTQPSAPSLPLLNEDNDNQEIDEQLDILNTSLKDLPDLEQLVNLVKTGEEQAPYPTLRTFWNSASPSEKTVFVNLFSTDEDPTYQEVRRHLADHIFYRPFHIGEIKQSFSIFCWPLHIGEIKRPINWISRDELPSRDEIPDEAEKLDAGIIAAKVDYATRRLLADCQFFHGTGTHDRVPLESLESILKSKKVQINIGACGKGAYCAGPLPAGQYGPYFLGFNQKIQYLSRQLIAENEQSRTTELTNKKPLFSEEDIRNSKKTFWVAFQRAIPVTQETLACIIVDMDELKIEQGKVDEYCKNISEKCKSWAGFPIPVIPLNEATENELVYQSHSKVAFPKEWQA